jgi:hypothetical protein
MIFEHVCAPGNKLGHGPGNGRARATEDLMNRTATAKILSWAAMVAASIYGAPAEAAPDDAVINGIAWTCSQEHDRYFHVQCVPQPRRAGTAGPTGETAGNSDQPPNDGAAREPAPAFRGHDMRPVAARGMPEVFSTKAWRIPLYSQPGNPAAIVNLLESVLCGGTAQCTVTYEGHSPVAH